MEGESHYSMDLTCEEKEEMMRWYVKKMLKKETCLNQVGHICMGSTTDPYCVECWRRNK
jgi:hypothetical protein